MLVAAHPADQLLVLRMACDVYAAAAAIEPSQSAVLYNWGVALSDMARAERAQRPGEAAAHLAAAAQKYSESLEANPGNHQALNNWALVLQDLSTFVPPGERAPFNRASTHLFRRSVRLRPDFNRACYNLGERTCKFFMTEWEGSSVAWSKSFLLLLFIGVVGAQRAWCVPVPTAAF